MIDINLVPNEQRKRQRVSLLSGIKVPLEVIIGSFGGFIMLLVLVHVGLLLMNFYKLNQHKNLKKEWDVILPAKENVDNVLQNMRALQAKHKAIEQITTGNRILWAQKLNILSDSIPRGVWLTRLRLNEGVFFIEGSAISKQADEMISVHTLTANLKSNDDFLRKFQDLELASIQRRYINKTEVADFLITADLVDLEEEEDGE